LELAVGEESPGRDAAAVLDDGRLDHGRDAPLRRLVKVEEVRTCVGRMKRPLLGSSEIDVEATGEKRVVPTPPGCAEQGERREHERGHGGGTARPGAPEEEQRPGGQDRKSTRLNSSHVAISYAVFCLKKKKKKTN